MPETICLDSLEEVEPSEACELDVWVRMPPDEHGSRYIRRKRYRTFKEIFDDIHKALDLIQCEKCGATKPRLKHNWWNNPPKCECGESEWFEIIDEYDSHPRDHHREIAERDEEIVSIICHSEVGGNEGYFAHMSVSLRGKWDAQDSRRSVDLYWIKSFRGMAHVHSLVKRMMIATGVWPNYKGDQ